jgi:hypothetical protein
MKKFFFIPLFLIFQFVFTQESEYNIVANIDPSNRLIKIEQEIIFFNSSNKNLDKIFLNDWPHSYSTANSQFGKRLSEDFKLNFQRSTKNQRGFTNITSVFQEDDEISYNRIKNQIDIIKIDLNKPLKSNEKTSIKIKYEIKIPISDFNGYGIDRDKNIVLSEWFLTLSKIKNNSWVKESNLDLDDISLDPSYFTFNISIPENYNLISDIFFEKEYSNNNVKNLISSKELKIHNSIILRKKNNFKNFKINNTIIVTDLYRENITKSDSVVNKLIKFIDDKSGNKILGTNNLNNNIDFNSILENTFNYVEDRFGEYPLKKLVLSDFNLKKHPIYGFNNIPDLFNPFEKSFTLEINVLKQIIQQYINNSFPIHKRVDYWEYKGIETFLLIDYINSNYPDKKLIGKFSELSFLKNREYSKYKFKEQFRLFDNIISSRNINQPIKTPLDSLTRVNYKIINPYKSGLALDMLNDFLGNNKIIDNIHEFSKTNKLKSYSNKTLLEIINKNHGSQWFNDFLKYDGNIDFFVKKIKSSKKSTQFLISNSTNLKIPIKLSLSQNDKSNSFWLNFKEKDTIIETKINSKIKINPNKYFSESNFSNNISSTERFRKKLKFVLFNDFDKEQTIKVNYIPLFNYNLYDGLMPGVSFSNSSIIRKPFIYKIVPYYSTKQNEILGKVNFRYTNYNKNKNNDLFSTDYFFGASTFHYKDDLSYNTFFPSILLTFRDKNLRSNSRKFLSFRYVSIFREENSYFSEYPNYNIFNIKYVTSNSTVEKAFNIKTDLQINKKFIKSSVTLNYRNFYKDNRQYNLRFFAGKFISNKTSGDYFSFSTYRARDYLFSANLLGRSENTGFYSQQYIGSEGGFKSKINTPYANDYIVALNGGITIWQWIEGYSGIAFIKNSNKRMKFDYESGVRLNILTDYFELFLPVYSSIGYELNQENYLSKVRFRISFDPKTLSGLISRRWF